MVKCTSYLKSKSLHDVLGLFETVNSNCVTPTEKISEFWNHHLQPIMRAGKSYIKDTGDLIGDRIA